MRTTLDMPDPLYREARARAALEGITFRHLMIDSLSARLQACAPDAASVREAQPEGRLERSARAAKPGSWKAQFDEAVAQLSLAAGARSGVSAVDALRADRSRLE